jgi:hypothetical protein
MKVFSLKSKKSEKKEVYLRRFSKRKKRKNNYGWKF